MAILILTGPPAAGKNTLGRLIAEQCKSCAVIDVDVVRWMVLQPHKAPWEGKEGQTQQILGVQNTCTLAKNFSSADFDVVILDVLTNKTAQIYKRELGVLELTTVLLLPAYDVIKDRNAVRGERLSPTEVDMLYDEQKNFLGYDFQLDNGILTIEETITQVMSFDIGFTKLT